MSDTCECGAAFADHYKTERYESGVGVIPVVLWKPCLEVERDRVKNAVSFAEAQIAANPNQSHEEKDNG